MLAASSSFSSPVAPTSRGKTTMALALFVGGLCTSRGRVTSLALFYPALSIPLCFDLIPNVITLNGNRYRTIVFFCFLSLFAAVNHFDIFDQFTTNPSVTTLPARQKRGGLHICHRECRYTTLSDLILFGVSLSVRAVDKVLCCLHRLTAKILNAQRINRTRKRAVLLRIRYIRATTVSSSKPTLQSSERKTTTTKRIDTPKRKCGWHPT